MLVLIFYFLTYFLVDKIKKKFNRKFKHFPQMKMYANGIIFTSLSQHRIKIDNMKYVQIGNKLHIKTEKEIITIINVDRIKKIEEYIYFTALGNVQILFDCKKIFRYFNVEIISSKFSICHLKQAALEDVLKNKFDITKSKILEKYINTIQHVLNIYINDEKIVVKQNKFLFDFTLKYRLNNRIKLININQTLEEN